MSPARADILAAVNRNPAGKTTAELAEELSATSYGISSNLSRLAAYGRIVKEGMPGPRPGMSYAGAVARDFAISVAMLAIVYAGAALWQHVFGG